jgi:hypothetical protein
VTHSKVRSLSPEDGDPAAGDGVIDAAAAGDGAAGSSCCPRAGTYQQGRGAVLAEQNDELTESRRYMGLEILASVKRSSPAWERMALVRLD